MKTESILIADDEAPIRLMLRTTLESEGYAICEAADGAEALEMIEREPPDLLILDLNMPRVDGMAVLEQMKAMTGARPRVVVLTAYGSIATAVKATRLGAEDFLEKPVTPTALREAVHKVLYEPEDVAPASIEQSARYDRVLDRVRRSFRAEAFESAESMLARAADQNARTSADYFNLLGILYETQGKRRLARKCYGKAMRADRQYKPAQQNMRRLYEQDTFGRSALEVALGDESEDVHAFESATSHG